MPPEELVDFDGIQFGPTNLEQAMEIVPFSLPRGVFLSVKLEDGRLAFWSREPRCWTTSSDEATLFETSTAALTELESGRQKMEAAFLKRTGIDMPAEGR